MHDSLPHDERVRLAWLHPVIAHYRVPIINLVAHDADTELINFSGQSRAGVGVDDASGEVEAPVQRLHNVRPPWDDARVLYSLGWERILTGRFDVVIITEASHNLVNWFLLASRTFFGYRVLVMGHIRPGLEDGRLSGWLRRRLIRAADGVIAYSEEGVTQATEWGVPPARIAAMGNTLDLERIERAKRELPSNAVVALRERLGVTGLTMLFVGRPTPIKRLDVAIDAMRELERRGVDATLVVVGDSAEREKARGSQRVHCAGAIFDESELAAYFALSDCVFIPGAVGLSVIHAFAYGVPILTASDVAHGPEMTVAREGVNAVMVERCDASLFADAIEKLVASPQCVRSLHEGARDTELNSADAMANEIVRMARMCAQS